MTKIINAIAFLFLLLLSFQLAAVSLNTDGDKVQKKVLLIGLDGLQMEVLKELDTPNLDQFFIGPAYAGGIRGTATEQSTFSGPGWTSILTGVWANKHDINSNFDTHRDTKFPSLFRRIFQAFPEAVMGSISSWPPIHDFFLTDLNLLTFFSDSDSDEIAVEDTLRFLKDENPDFVFVHLGAIDTIGHIFCFGDKYNQAILKIDSQIGRITDAINERAENWLIILTTDHGRKTNGCNHGGQSLSEKTAFIATNKEKYKSPTPVNPDIYSNPPLTRTADIVLDFLEIPVNRDKSVNASHISAVLDWSETTAFFFLTDGQYIKFDKQSDRAIQTAAIDDHSWPGLASHARHITAALNGSETTAILFLDNGQFISIDKATRQILALDNINQQTWPGLKQYAHRISAAINWSNDIIYILLNNGRYLQIEKKGKRILQVSPIDNQTSPGLKDFALNIIGISNWSESDAYIFLDTGQYLKFNRHNYHVIYVDDVNTNTWPGL